MQVRFQYTFETVVGFILPYAIITTSYVLILRRLRRTKFQRKIRSEKLILAIVITFGIFWFPYHVINMIAVSETMFIRTDLKTMRHISAFELSFLNLMSKHVCSALSKVAAAWYKDGSDTGKM